MSLPDFDPLPDRIEGPVLLKVGDNVCTDEISPAGARALPYRSNIPKLAEFTFTRIDREYPETAAAATNGHRPSHRSRAGHPRPPGSPRVRWRPRVL